ncbi:MAG: peptidylprolyl isomerase [Patescibacteria group bacterium]|nr:peptidylprolyl isomerase [Patescibacteria group bacterium]
MGKIPNLAIIFIAICLLSGCSLKNTDNTGENKANQLNEEKTVDQILNNNATNTINNNTMENNSSNLAPIFAANPAVATTTDAELLANYSFALIKTNFGDIKVKLYKDDSPKTVVNFYRLSLVKFYDGIKFHRVIKDFMIQGGDPNSREADWSRHGTGGPGYSFEDEINTHPLVAGSLAMANSGPDTNGSQFFIVTAEATPWLDGKHTNFGEVVEGMDVVKKIEAVEVNQNDHPLKDVVINSIDLLK